MRIFASVCRSVSVCVCCLCMTGLFLLVSGLNPLSPIPPPAFSDVNLHICSMSDRGGLGEGGGREGWGGRAPSVTLGLIGLILHTSINPRLNSPHHPTISLLASHTPLFILPFLSSLTKEALKALLSVLSPFSLSFKSLPTFSSLTYTARFIYRFNTVQYPIGFPYLLVL